MRLAWFNIAHDRMRFVVTVLGIMCAVFLMVFQGSMLVGFLRAASKIIDSTDADIWIAGRGVPCFEFPVPIERRLAEIARGIPGVAESSQIATAQIQIRLPDGIRQQAILIGAEPQAGAQIPIPRLNGASGPLAPEALVVDRSNAELLEVNRVPMEVEANNLHARITGETSGFSSFIGSPYVFSSFDDAVKYLSLGPNETMFLLLRLKPGAKEKEVLSRLRARFPNVDVWTRAQFARRARWYWISKTGAGGAILMAALLGFFIGLAVVSQAVYATTMENIEEFATLKAIGASRRFVMLVILAQAAICGAAGYMLGTLITLPLVKFATVSIPWISTPLWLPLAALVPALGMCLLASVLSVRAALGVEPARVFRA
ncbi:MAG TPA: ABC transporter permease [Bryobacteraceae bacterium]|jgi:putative ABC transport system permease protein|nr:ABC transporter permease [Bryobacteraceae bacterium]